MKLKATSADFQMFNLIQEGVLLKTDKIKITYRLKSDYVETPNVCIFGFKHGETEPVMLSLQTDLDEPTCGREMKATMIIELANEPGIVDMFARINNIQSIQNVYNIIGVFDTTTAPQGEDASTGDFDCNEFTYPIATAATNVTTTSFTANWNAATGADHYLLDVSADIDFTTFVYENESVSGTSFNATGLTANTCYFYRVRAVNSDDIESRYSNKIHVQYVGVLIPVVPDDGIKYYHFLGGTGAAANHLICYGFNTPITGVGGIFEFKCDYNMANMSEYYAGGYFCGCISPPDPSSPPDISGCSMTEQGSHYGRRHTMAMNPMWGYEASIMPYDTNWHTVIFRATALASSGSWTDMNGIIHFGYTYSFEIIVDGVTKTWSDWGAYSRYNRVYDWLIGGAGGTISGVAYPANMSGAAWNMRNIEMTSYSSDGSIFQQVIIPCTEKPAGYSTNSAKLTNGSPYGNVQVYVQQVGTNHATFYAT